jgi:hypothetical protein
MTAKGFYGIRLQSRSPSTAFVTAQMAVFQQSIVEFAIPTMIDAGYQSGQGQRDQRKGLRCERDSNRQECQIETVNFSEAKYRVRIDLS